MADGGHTRSQQQQQGGEVEFASRLQGGPDHHQPSLVASPPNPEEESRSLLQRGVLPTPPGHRSSLSRETLSVSVRDLTPHHLPQPVTASSVRSGNNPSQAASAHGSFSTTNTLLSGQSTAHSSPLLPTQPPVTIHTHMPPAAVAPVDFSPPVQTHLLAPSPVLLTPDDGAPAAHYSLARRHSRHLSDDPGTSGAGLAIHTSPVQPKPPITPMPTEDELHAKEDTPMVHAGSPSRSPNGSVSPNKTAYGVDSPTSPGPRHTKSGNRCCFCIPWSSDPAKRLSFITLMAILVFFQVVVSCIIVWLLGYLSTMRTVASLTSTIRDSIMHDVAFELNDAMQQPLEAAYDIDQLVTQRFPDLATRTSIRDEPGWLAELSYVAMRYPRLSRVGFATRNNVYVLITKGVDSSGGSDAAFTSANGSNMSISVSEPNAADQTQTAMLYNYRPSPIRNTTSVAPFSLVPEILQTDSAAAIESYLGPPISSQSSFTVTTRPFYQAAVDVFSSGQAAGWSNVYSSSNVNVAGSFFLAIAAVNARAALDDPNTFGFATFAVTNLDNLNSLLDGLPLGDHGFGYFIRTNGHVVSSSVSSINDQIRSTVAAGGNGPFDLDMFHSHDDWLTILTPILLDWNLITRQAITSRNSSLLVPYRPNTYERSVSYSGSQYHVQAVMLTNTTSGLPLSAVIVTKDSDFDADVRANVIITVVLSLVIAVVAGFIAALVTSCLARPMMEVVHFMERSVKIIEMDRNEKQRKELSILCEEWSGSSGMVLPPLLTSAAFVGMAIKEDPEAAQRRCCGACCDPRMGCLACGGVGRSLREVQSMHRAFGSMLYSLASYDELEAINHAKRAFIRYIFHEVRVPFNAIVLGIEQMELELRDHSSLLTGALDTLSIISEQSQVVSRILNDVLSMQKIEDGALTLEYDVFSMEKMIRNSLYAFRSPCMDKRIKVKVDLQSIDELISAALPAFRIGEVITPGMQSIDEFARGGPPKENGEVVVTTSEPSHSSADSSRDRHGRHPSNGSVGQADIFVGLPTPIGSTPNRSSIARHSRSRNSYMHRAYVRGDPYRLRQVFSNLITNAIKFSPLGGRIHVELTASNFIVSPFAAAANLSLLMGENKYSIHPQPSPATTPAPGTPVAGPSSTNGTPVLTHLSLGPSIDRAADGTPIAALEPPTPPMPLPEILGTLQVRVCVRDSGPGVPAAEAAHLFQAYMQVNAGKTQKGNGTGLGLSISKSIVELHGGQIGFNTQQPSDGTSRSNAILGDSRGSSSASQDGCGGAEFYFTIPLDVSLVKSRSSSNSSLSGSHVGSITFSSGGHSSDGSGGGTSGAPSNSTMPATMSRFELGSGGGGGAGGTSTNQSSMVGQGFPRSVNFADEVSYQEAPHGPSTGAGDLPMGVMDEEDEIHPTSDQVSAIFSPHVGLVHRTHTIDIASQAASPRRAELTAAMLTQSAQGTQPPMRSALHTRAGSAHRLMQLRTAGAPLVVGPSYKPSHAHSDSVVDIAPLAESGIGADTAEQETSISRIRFHEDGADQYEEWMDPTKGDWDHIEQPKDRAANRTSGGGGIYPASLDCASVSDTPRGQPAPPSGGSGLTPSLPNYPTPSPTHISSALDRSVSDERERKSTLPPQSHQSHSPSAGSTPGVSNNSNTIPTYTDVAIAPMASTRASTPSASSGSSHGLQVDSALGQLSTSPSLSQQASKAQSSPTQGALPPRQLPPKLNVGGSAHSSPPATGGAVGSSQARSTHAIDLASFITEEQKAAHRSAQMAPPSGGAGWAPAHTINLSPSGPNSGQSSPSTPFLSSSSAGVGGGAARASSSTMAAKPPTGSVKLPRGSKAAIYKDACRVLVVEDSLPNRKLLVSLLGRLKCVAQGVEDGQQCVDLFAPWMQGPVLNVAGAAAASAVATHAANANAQHPGQPSGHHTPPADTYPFDIILIDGTMPVMNGVVATQLLRSHGITIPIVAVTGNALAEDVSAFMMAGANSVLTKPVNLKELLDVLSRFCPPTNTNHQANTPPNHQQTAAAPTNRPTDGAPNRTSMPPA